MTYLQIIEQAETLSINEQKSLLSYLFLKYMNPDKQNLMQLFHYKDDYMTKIEKNSKKVWKSKANIKLNNDFEASNLRESIYDDEFYKHIITG